MKRSRKITDEQLIDRLLYDLQDAITQYRAAIERKKFVEAMRCYVKAKIDVMQRYFDAQGIEVPKP